MAFRIPDDFRAMVRDVIARLDFGDEGSVVGARAFEAECGFGGRVDKKDLFRFQYIANGGHERYEVELRQQQLRDIAAGLIEEVDARALEGNSRVARGEPLLVWGEYDEDALRVRSLTDLGVALDALYSIGGIDPVLFRLWSTGDDQIVGVCNGIECALYIVASQHGYGTSVGDPTRNGTFELTDHDVGPVAIPWADCVSWRIARPALLRFAEHGDLGTDVMLDGSLPSIFLMLGDYDRAAELATRRTPMHEPARTSLPQKAPCGAWADRLLNSLIELHLIEVDPSIQEAISARFAMLLQQYGEEAQDSGEIAQKLTKDLEKVRGVGALFATAGDLQIALRRTQDPPTQPVETTFR
ncbi:MAG: hypothetical protein JO257_11940 [Deltaproteobacteria bacterium]|nr:hypothetical protein [Deltaproteobacteria bacterium]